MVNEWTRDDLPSVIKSHRYGNMHFSRIQEVEAYKDDVVDHLNANYPKPTPGLLSSAADCVLDAEDRVRSAKSDAARWRRAHEIVEAERDQARRQRDEARHKVATLVHDIEWHQRRMGEHCDDVDAAERERDEWKARAEAAEARTALAVSRADVAEVLGRCLNPEMWNVTFPSVVNEVCDLFGVEAEQATDPVEDKARELYRAATPDARWETVADEYRRIAAYVLGQEAGQ